MLLADDQQGIHSDSNYDRGNAIQDVSGKSHNSAELASRVFRQIDSRSNSQGDTDEAAGEQNDRRSDDRIRHSASRLTRTAAGDVGEECDIERRDSANH